MRVVPRSGKSRQRRIPTVRCAGTTRRLRSSSITSRRYAQSSYESRDSLLSLSGVAMAKMKALVCRECGKEYPTKAIHVCDMCFGPLEVKYNYEEIKKTISRRKIEDGPLSMWRYIDLLPVEGAATVGPHAGFTPMVPARNLAAYLGLDELYLKNDTVNHPTLSFKDRVVAVALTRARELGFETVACASTGNLANSVAAHAAAAGMQCYVFIPHDLEAAKVLGNLVYRPNVVEVEGNYDDVNRSEEHTSELQSLAYLVCRLLLEKKKKQP